MGRSVARGARAAAAWIALAVAPGCLEGTEILGYEPGLGSTGAAAGGAGGGGGGGTQVPFPSFAPAETHALGCPSPAGEGHVVAADANGDGHRDLLVASDCLTLIVGDGPAGLGAAHLAAPSGFGFTLAVGQLDTPHPGDADPIDAVSFAAASQLYLGAGDGSFQLDHALGVQGPAHVGALGIGALAGSEALDVVVTAGSEAHLLVNDGTGLLHADGVVGLGGLVAGHALGDLDGDGEDDVLVALAAGGLRAVRRTGTVLHGPTAIEAAGTARHVLVGRLDADGCVDAVALPGTPGLPSGTDGVVRILRNACDGSGALALRQSFGIGEVIHGALADLNGDGRLDLALLRGAPSDDIHVLRGLGDGHFEEATAVAQVAGAVTIVAADLTEDGKIDLAAVGSAGVHFLRNVTK
jgi:hypothetical protein